MGRLGPLTSMALGRSPYDHECERGEGESDPRAPPQMYDDRGRPINPETKRVNRDIVRSHNEVMLVIGVVESETSIDEMRAEQLRRYEHERDDERVGRNLEWASRVCELSGIWGLSGVRHRIYLYKEYSHVPFSRLFRHERQLQSPVGLWLHGLPAFMAANITDFAWFEERIMRSAFLKIAFSYVQTSLRIWIFLQRSHLLPASASPWFPSWKYFIPFTSASAIPPCPLPSSLSVRTVAGWLGSLTMSIAPLVAFWAVHGIWVSASDLLFEEIYELLPNPSNPNQPRMPNSGFILQRVATERELESAQAQSQPVPEALVASGEGMPIQVQPAAPQDSDVWDVPQSTDQSIPADNSPGQSSSQERSTTPTTRNDNTTAGPSRPRSHPRRSRVPDTDEFSSDDEATEEVVSATLISFDVENNPDNPDPTSDSNMPPGGVWSAELRPNPGNDSSGGGDGYGRDGDGGKRPPKVYRDNILTQLPASIAAGILARRVSTILLAPLEASSMREIAWLWCRSRGWSTEALWEPVWFWPLTLSGRSRFGFRFDLGAGFSFGSAINFIGLEISHLLFDAFLWGYIPLVVSKHLISDEEWEKRQNEAERRAQQQQEDGTPGGVSSDRTSRNELSG